MCDCILEDEWVTLLASRIAYFGPQIPITSNDKCKSAVYHCMRSMCMYMYIYWLVVSTPLKIWVSWDDYSIYIYISLCIGIVSLRASVLSPFRSSWTRTLLGGLWNVHNSYETCTTSMERAQLLWNVRNSHETCATSMFYVSSQTLQKTLNDTIPIYIYVYGKIKFIFQTTNQCIYKYIYIQMIPLNTLDKFDCDSLSYHPRSIIHSVGIVCEPNASALPNPRSSFGMINYG